MTQDYPDATKTANRSPGRPREPETDERILDATYRLMAQHGYARMSMDAIAAEAGVTKPTIYRRYGTKIELAMAALVYTCDPSRPPITGDTRVDLIAELEHFRRALSRPYGMSLLGTVLAEEHETPELLAAFREYLVAPRRGALRAILEAGRTRGEFSSGTDLAMAANLLVGAYYAQYVAGAPFADDWAARAVEMVLDGLSHQHDPVSSATKASVI
jgi:AcrR family transcriptional regulator